MWPVSDYLGPLDVSNTRECHLPFDEHQAQHFREKKKAAMGSMCFLLGGTAMFDKQNATTSLLLFDMSRVYYAPSRP